jgi:hypothetical protein
VVKYIADWKRVDSVRLAARAVAGAMLCVWGPLRAVRGLFIGRYFGDCPKYLPARVIPTSQSPAT